MRRVPEPTVHTTEPYTKRRWRFDVGRAPSYSSWRHLSGGRWVLDEAQRFGREQMRLLDSMSQHWRGWKP